MKQFLTFADVLNHIGSTYSNPKAFNLQDGKGEWVSESSQSFVQKVKFLALGLVKRGLVHPGEKVGLMGRPCPNWTIADFAIAIAGGITVPLFGNISPENLIFEVEQTEVKTLFVEGEAEWIKYGQHRDLFQTVVALEERCPDDTAIHLADLLAEGELFDKEQPHYYETLMQAVKPDNVSSIIYSSGSTGRPKGVELTQRQLVELIHLDPFGWDAESDRYLSFLPLAHIFARCLNYIMVAHGVSIYYLEDPKTLLQATHHVRPTILVLVPRLLEKMRVRLINRIHDSGYMLSRIGGWALRLADREEDSTWIRFQRWLADSLVYNAFRKAFGGEVRLIISGGAKLNPHLETFFVNMGFPIYEGWGMTEGCPFSVNREGARKIGSVGLPLTGVEIRVSDEGELIVRGPNVMRGYFKDPEETARALDADGWFHTGDKGSIDQDGFVTIVGRVKEMYKTSTGEWVVPLPIEQTLERLPWVDHALVIAEGRPFCTCILFPDFDALYHLKASYGMTNYSDAEFLKSPQVRDAVLAHIKEMNRHLNHWEEVRDYRFVQTILTVESGELTPTLKVRRDVVADKYHVLIDSMYQREVKP